MTARSRGKVYSCDAANVAVVCSKADGACTADPAWLVMDTGAVSGSCTSSQRQTKFDLPIHSATSGRLQRSRKHHTKKYQHMTTSISRATSSHLSHTFAHNTQSAHVASQKTCRTHSRGYSGPTKGFYRLSPPELRGSDAQSHASSCRRPATTSSL